MNEAGILEEWNNGKNIYFLLKTQYSSIPLFHSLNWTIKQVMENGDE
jgi:hypothetical protein